MTAAAQPTLPLEKLSAAEARFERLRNTAGAIAAPIIFLTILLLPIGALNPEAQRLAAVMAAVVVLWLTEALPMPVTAMLGAAACVALRVAPAKQVFAPFADQLIFLFIGGFILARGVFLHALDRRLAFAVLSMKGVGARPGRILIAFGAVTAFLSAWISNTAATAMMFTIGLSILAFLFEQERRGGKRISRNYATGLMLMTTFAASIGGLSTPIGTAPNLIGLSMIRRETGVEIPFFQWSLIGVPIVVVLFLWLSAYLGFLCRAGVKEIEGSHEMLLHERQRLGAWTTAQVSTLIAFLIAVALWVAPGIVALHSGTTSEAYKLMRDIMPEGVAAVIGATLLFILPGNRAEDGTTQRAINWKQAVQIDWGVVLLYGGGLALGELADKTGLARVIGEALAGLVPLAGSSTMMIVAASLAAVMISETTSNTASATIIVPVVIAVARGAGVDPVEPALAATMAASLGFMLPVSTPCNAIVYGSGYVPLGRMMRYGVLLDLVGVIIIVTMVKLLAPLLR